MKIWYVLAMTAATAAVWATPRYILRYTESVPLNSFLQQYELQLESQVAGEPIYAVRDPLSRPPASLIAAIDDDQDEDVSLELDQTVRLPISSFTRPQQSNRRQLELALKRNTPSVFFGSPSIVGFALQHAATWTRSDLSWSIHGLGQARVAVIDTGIDPTHPFFQGFLEPGVDWLVPGNAANELQGVSEDVLGQINPTTTPILQRRFEWMSPGIAPTMPARGGRPAVQLNSWPAALGHGTMVAGAVRLVAPGARIIPIRAFGLDGTGSLYNIIRSLYAAEDRGAKVVNMSFNLYTPSPILERATEELSGRGILLVASTGNDGRLTGSSFPASYAQVVGVASVAPNGTRSLFSNASPSMAFVAAPGEALLLPYPGGIWAGGWGTSFAAPLVSGFAVKVLQRNPQASNSDLQSALGHSVPLPDPNLGKGRLDVAGSLSSW